MVPRIDRIRAVLFDLDGTLVDLTDFAGWCGVARRWNLDFDEDHLAHAYREVEREFDRAPPVPTRAEWWSEVLSRAHGARVTVEVGERFLAGIRNLPPTARVFSDVRGCLASLARDRRRLGVVSNSRSEEFVRDLLREAGLGMQFGAVVSSGTEGVAKPDPAIFRRATRRLGVAPPEAFHVGDLAYADAVGARLAGLRSVWLRRDGTGLEDGPPEITSLTELPGYLRRIERGSTS